MNTSMVNGSVQTITTAVRDIQSATYLINGLQVPVRVLDARKVWGRVDVLIEPIGGSGQVWVAQTQIKMEG